MYTAVHMSRGEDFGFAFGFALRAKNWAIFAVLKGKTCSTGLIKTIKKYFRSEPFFPLFACIRFQNGSSRSFREKNKCAENILKNAVNIPPFSRLCVDKAKSPAVCEKSPFLDPLCDITLWIVSFKSPQIVDISTIFEKPAPTRGNYERTTSNANKTDADFFFFPHR